MSGPDVVVIVASRELEYHVRRALDGYAQRAADDIRSALADTTLVVLGGIRTHSDAFGGMAVASPEPDAQPALMTRTEVADLTGVSTDTVSRWSTAGLITKHGRRYTRDSVLGLLLARAADRSEGINHA